MPDYTKDDFPHIVGDWRAAWGGEVPSTDAIVVALTAAGYVVLLQADESAVSFSLDAWPGLRETIEQTIEDWQSAMKCIGCGLPLRPWNEAIDGELPPATPPYRHAIVCTVAEPGVPFE